MKDESISYRSYNGLVEHDHEPYQCQAKEHNM